ncbi:2108_t:CDS:1, partial [Cetraspora pellucida]
INYDCLSSLHYIYVSMPASISYWCTIGIAKLETKLKLIYSLKNIALIQVNSN